MQHQDQELYSNDNIETNMIFNNTSLSSSVMGHILILYLTVVTYNLLYTFLREKYKNIGGDKKCKR